MISRRTVYPIAAVATARILAHLIRFIADLTSRTLVDILTGSAVDAESISVGTLARVTARRILANADAEIIVLKFRAFVDIAAGSIIGI